MHTFSKSVVGGTFDHMHKGHRHLLRAAFERSDHVIVGIATNALHSQKNFLSSIQSYTDRKAAVEAYIHEHNLNAQASIIAIDDLYGTTLQDKDIQAIFITNENIPAVEKINDARHKRGFSTLEAIIVPQNKDTTGIPISSERIRAGIVDREGNVFLDYFSQKQQYLLPEAIRDKVRQPIGILYKDLDDVLDEIPKSAMLIAVGDIISTSLLAKDRQAHISIVDNKTRRHTEYDSKQLQLHAKTHPQTENAPGSIKQGAVLAIHKALDDSLSHDKLQVVVISGEEDLLTIPAILLAPLGTIVLYGQFDRGIVCVPVTIAMKDSMFAILKKFTS